MTATPETHLHQCTICEAACGLEIETVGREVRSIRGDAKDVFSHGYVCPKGASLKELDADPDRLRQPLLKRDGVHVPVSWDEAFEAIDAGLRPIIDAHGPDAVGTYVGNPGAHNTSLITYVSALLTGFRTRNRFSASTVDQVPKQVANGLMFGTSLSVPIPDIDRTQYLLMLGANPMASNGSLFTAPDFRGRARKLRERGGRLVVVDPRRSETAGIADEHLPIRPGTDALLLAGIVHTLFDEQLVALGRLEEWTIGVDVVEQAIAPFSAETVSERCGVTAETIRRLARELAAPDGWRGQCHPRSYGTAMQAGSCRSGYGLFAQHIRSLVLLFATLAYPTLPEMRRWSAVGSRLRNTGGPDVHRHNEFRPW